MNYGTWTENLTHWQIRVLQTLNQEKEKKTIVNVVHQTHLDSNQMTQQCAYWLGNVTLLLRQFPRIVTT